jgi:phytanoyl-CoA hydroxylase
MNTLPWIDKADANIDSYMKKVSEKYGFDLKEKLVHWQDKGYVVFENVVDTKLIDALVNDIEYLKAHHKDFELFVEMKGDIKKISDYSKEELLFEGIKFNSIQTISKAAARLSLTKEVSTFLNHIFQSPAAVLQSLTFYKGSQQPAHIDYPYVRCQTKLPHMAASWIPLEDVDPTSGPLAYFPGSHKTVSGFFD